MTDEEIEEAVIKNWGKGYTVKILEIIRRSQLILVRYRVKADRDGAIEWRLKGWGNNAMSGWDYPYRRKF